MYVSTLVFPFTYQIYLCDLNQVLGLAGWKPRLGIIDGMRSYRWWSIKCPGQYCGSNIKKEIGNFEEWKLEGPDKSLCCKAKKSLGKVFQECRGELPWFANSYKYLTLNLGYYIYTCNFNLFLFHLYAIGYHPMVLLCQPVPGLHGLSTLNITY